MKKSRYIRYGAWWHLKTYAPRTLRLSFFVLCVLAAGLLLFWQRAQAHVTEQLWGVGLDMLRYEGAEDQEAPRTLRLNGQAVQLSTGLAPHSLDQVLNHFERQCSQRNARLSEEIQKIQRDHGLETTAPESSLFDGTVREQVDRKGFVACFDSGGAGPDTEGLAERVKRFAKTWDLAEFGGLRYIYAQQSDDTTFFVALWTEGSVKLLEMFPERGDVPGHDVKDVPRPPSSQRILSAWEEGQPHTITTYAGSPWRAAKLERHYRKAMADKGWRLLEAPSRVETEGPDGKTRWVPFKRNASTKHRTLTWERGTQMVSVIVDEDDKQRGLATVLVSR